MRLDSSLRADRIIGCFRIVLSCFQTLTEAKVQEIVNTLQILKVGYNDIICEDELGRVLHCFFSINVSIKDNTKSVKMDFDFMLSDRMGGSIWLIVFLIYSGLSKSR